MYYSNLAISVLYGAIMSQPMTYWRGAAALLLTKVVIYFDHDGEIC